MRHEGLSTQTVSEDFFWPKTGLNLSEDLFFWSSPNFGPKPGPNLSEDLFFWSSPNVRPKNGLNFSEDLFFSLHLSFGRKADLVLGWKIFILVFIILKFSEFPAPLPPFENPAYATASAIRGLEATPSPQRSEILQFFFSKRT